MWIITVCLPSSSSSSSCTQQCSKTSPVCRQNARNNHRSPGREAGAAAVRDVHSHRREWPEDRSGHKEKLPPQLQHWPGYVFDMSCLFRSFLPMCLLIVNCFPRFIAQSFQRLHFQQWREAALAAEIWRQNHVSRSAANPLTSLPRSKIVPWSTATT